MFRKLIAAAAAAAMAFDGLGAVGAGAAEKVEKVISTENVTADASGAVQSRTAEQILAYMKAHPFNFNNDTFAETPVYSGGTYSLGKVSSASLNNALNALNCVRYVAGLDEVTLDDTYGKYAQAASLVNAANGDISHSPSRPSGMSDELYNLGKTGSGSSNLGYGYSSLAYEVIFGWMSDSYGSNLSCAGHRRWCLYPLMKKTGFGHAGSATAMYAFDGFSSSTGSYNVTWPAAKMPTSMFNTGFPWTYSRDKTFSSNTVVTLTRKRDSKKWVFSSSSADGVFYINNDGYGQKGCLIFRPSGIDSYGEDQFTVTVTEGSSSFSYTVDFISACLHNNVYSYSAGKATCTSDGNTAYWYCDDCGKYFSDSACTNEITKASTVIKATGHKTTATAAKAATCTTAGNTAYWYCSNCGKYFSDSACTNEITKAGTVIKATGHKTTATAAKAATCTTAGNTAYWYCSNCGKYFSDSACTNEITKAGTVIKATGHKTTATAAKAATCTENGNKAYWYCSNCGKHFSDSACTNEITKASTVIKATGHKTTATAAKAATCTTAGNTAYWYCSNCGKYFSDSACTNEITKASTVIKATGHKTTATAAKAATCTENGNKAYWYCSNCGKYFSDSACTNEITKASTVIKATGHKTTATAAKAATCTENGNKAYWYCSNCGKYFSDSACTNEITKASTVIKATGHKTTATAAKAATCTTAGNTAYWYCSNCGKYFSDSACTNEITKASTVIKATGHKTTATAAKAATCTTAGNTAYWYCSNCGKYFSDSACTNEITKASTVIKATGHKTTATAAKAATCTTAGNTAYWYCSNCGKYFSDSACTNEITKAGTVIKATGHKTTATAAKAATCTTAGNTAYWYCSNCGKYFSDSACTNEITKASTVIKATGHSFGPWKITREPTTTSQGEKERECSVCHIHEVSAIPQLPAGTAPQITADRVTASAGKTVTVDIRIKNNPGIASLSLEAAYDSSVMTLVKAESGIYAGTSFGPVGTEPLVISWSAGGGTDNIQNGLLARLTFEVKEKAGKGKYPITLSYTEGKIYNKEHKNVNFSAVSGSVEVRSYLIGDVNGNGSVNMKDLAELQRYVNGWGNVIVEEAADLASPFGKINMKDIAALQKLLNSQ